MKPGRVQIAPGMELPQVSQDDPRVRAAMRDPRVQRVLAALRTSSDHTLIEEAMKDQAFPRHQRTCVSDRASTVLRCASIVGFGPTHGKLTATCAQELTAQLQMLMAAGIIDIRRPR
jgi:hypothetical protein